MRNRIPICSINLISLKWPPTPKFLQFSFSVNNIKIRPDWPFPFPQLAFNWYILPWTLPSRCPTESPTTNFECVFLHFSSLLQVHSEWAFKEWGQRLKSQGHWDSFCGHKVIMQSTSSSSITNQEWEWMWASKDGNLVNRNRTRRKVWVKRGTYKQQVIPLTLGYSVRYLRNKVGVSSNAPENTPQISATNIIFYSNKAQVAKQVEHCKESITKQWKIIEEYGVKCVLFIYHGATFVIG